MIKPKRGKFEISMDWLISPLQKLHWFIVLTIGFWIFLYTGDSLYAVGWMMLLFSIRFL